MVGKVGGWRLHNGPLVLGRDMGQRNRDRVAWRWFRVSADPTQRTHERRVVLSSTALEKVEEIERVRREMETPGQETKTTG